MFGGKHLESTSLTWSTITVNDRKRPARSPFGGSLVTLMLICSRPIGNLGWGSLVMNSRKSAWHAGSVCFFVVVAVESSGFSSRRPRSFSSGSKGCLGKKARGLELGSGIVQFAVLRAPERSLPWSPCSPGPSGSSAEGPSFHFPSPLQSPAKPPPTGPVCCMRDT